MTIYYKFHLEPICLKHSVFSNIFSHISNLIIDRESNTLHHQAKEALHIRIKDPSLNRNTGKIRIPSVFIKLLKPSRQLELPYSSIPHPRGAPSSPGLSTQKTINASHLLDLHLQ